MYSADVVVTLKPVVNDPQGVTVRAGLGSLGFGQVKEVRVGKYLRIDLEAPSRQEAEAAVEAMCRQLLANSVIEDFRFSVAEAARPAPVEP
jgi:phosphoribosylformylglycinamidine synthase